MAHLVGSNSTRKIKSICETTNDTTLTDRKEHLLESGRLLGLLSSISLAVDVHKESAASVFQVSDATDRYL